MIQFLTVTGKRKQVNYNKYKIDWDSQGRSKFQKRIKDFLNPYWNRYVVCEEFPLPGTRLTFDFFNITKLIAIEVQGAQHLKYIPYFHQNKNNFLNQMERDAQKLKFCQINNIRFIEIYPGDEPLTIDFFKDKGIELSV